MGVYIRGMEIPNECRNCQMMVYHVNTGKTWCTPMDRILADKYKTISFDGRPDWCPLVEVKEPHGDLIDRDELQPDIFRDWEDCGYNAEDAYSERCIANALAVIKAEGAAEK